MIEIGSPTNIIGPYEVDLSVAGIVIQLQENCFVRRVDVVLAVNFIFIRQNDERYGLKVYPWVIECCIGC